VVAALFLVATLLSPNTCSGVVVWQDDFNDGNHDGWAIYQGDMGIVDNALVATAAFWSFARYSSTVAYGYWSFDILSEDAPQNHTYVYVISPDTVTNYRLCIWTGSFAGWATGPGVSLLKQSGGSTISIADWFTTSLSGWHSYNVTRDNTGEFRIYVDGTLRITVTDNDITTSLYFRFGAEQNSGIDNVVVGEDAPTTSSPPPTPPIPGFPFAAILLAVPLAFALTIIMRRRNTQ
jgi:hypothetical protein